MDGCADKALESVTLKTLHAHAFGRASTLATSTLTDLLSRYLTLLASTCAHYANHANRTTLNARDALSALAELGVDVEELREYAADEGAVLARYATHAPKRAEDLADMHAALRRGLPTPPEPISLVYAPVPDDALLDSDEDEDDTSDVELLSDGDKSMRDVHEYLRSPERRVDEYEPMSIDTRPSGIPTPTSPRTRPVSPPPLPLSPVSNPASPRPSKRPRTERWRAPDHIPSFLPPFPTVHDGGDDVAPLALPEASTLQTSRPQLHPEVKRERSATPPPPPRHMSSAPADYSTTVPYAESTLNNYPEWHLPGPIRPAPPAPPNTRLPTPAVQPALLGAYHHVLTHPPPPTPSPSLAPAARHRVALAFLGLVAHGQRWEPAPTLFGGCAPNVAASAAPGPSCAIPVDREAAKTKKLPAITPRSTTTQAQVAPLVGQQSSRIPELAREALSGPILARTTRLHHPPALKRGDGERERELTFGVGVAAPWNAPLATADGGTGAGGAAGAGKEKEKERESLRGGNSNGAAPAPRALPDARLFGTWEYEPKKPHEPLLVPRRAKVGTYVARMGGNRGRSESRA